MTALCGRIESITYSNPLSGFTVVRLRADGLAAPVTVVGTFVAPGPGEELELEGQWERHPTFGAQFRVSDYRLRVPVTPEGIRRYLGSGLIKGIGPRMAERIVARFGGATLEVIDGQIERLSEVPGIGPKRRAEIGAAWQAQKHLREVMVFLHAYGVGAALAVRIARHYGGRTMALLRGDPYRLAAEIHGVGFKTADRIAAELGFAPADPRRLSAGLLYTLRQAAEEGHAFCPRAELLPKAAVLLGIEGSPLEAALGHLMTRGAVVEENFTGAPAAVYDPYLHGCESAVAQGLQRLLASPLNGPSIDPLPALPWIQQRFGLELGPEQAQALKTAFASKMVVITGGPGTGKTTIIRGLVDIFQARRVRCRLAAPTGRAAKRLSEATGGSAQTLHRLLEYSPQEGGFLRHAERPLEVEAVIVDEASMIDLVMMAHLVRALPAGARLVLVGDVHQLPSVGPGNVLGDIIAAGCCPVAVLEAIYRQAAASRIVVNAHRIKAGRVPDLQHRSAGAGQDFFFVEREDPEAAVATIVDLVARRIPRRFGLDPLKDVQVLVPMRRGPAGVEGLNRALQEALNPGPEALGRGERGFKPGDRVMQVRNNYEKDVFNGDIGRVAGTAEAGRRLRVDFEGREVDYEVHELDELVLAYAVSVHKSQGSEFPAVVMPLLTQHYVMLQRNLLYTAVTRAQRLMVLVGSRQALARAVANDRIRRRHTALARRLRLNCA
jgi:exodeoxyribonuclease V alpha subunit